MTFMAPPDTLLKAELGFFAPPYPVGIGRGSNGSGALMEAAVMGLERLMI